MNAVGSVAIAISGNTQNQGLQRQNPTQQALQQIVQFLAGYMAGSMLGQAMGGPHQGCLCSQRQNPNFGGNANALAGMQGLMAGLQLGGALANQGGNYGIQQPGFGLSGGFPSNHLGFQQPAFGGLPGGFPGTNLSFQQPAFGGIPGGFPDTNLGFQQPAFGGIPGGFPSTNLGFQQPGFGNSNGLFAGMPSLGLTGLQNANSLYNGLPNGLNGVPNPYEMGQPITGLAAGLPSLAFNVLGQNPNPGFAGSTNIVGLIPPVQVPPLPGFSPLGALPPVNAGFLPGAFGGGINSFLG
ncbi:MAG: hypothetical protein AMXMBFR33_57170 [Candidatus Xenobia bacterium]